MSRHLRPIEQPTRPGRLESREEILEWVEERRRVLTALAEAERLGQGRQRTPEHTQLSFEEQAA